MKIIEAEYITSAVKKEDLLVDGIDEFAFVGRSNVGKSSLINMLVGQKKLARTSSTPGLTKMVNYFIINGKFRFVDLPGYGFAKVGKGQMDVWASLIGDYLRDSESLRTVFVLVDIRHSSQLDRQMIEFLVYYQLPLVVLATKADKIAKSKIKPAVQHLALELHIRPELIIPTSSESGFGKQRILDYIESLLEQNNAS